MMTFAQKSRMNFKLLAAGLLASSILVVLASSSAMAGCNKFGRGKDCAQPTPTPNGNTFAYVYGSNFDSGDFPVYCASGANTTAGGSYSCSDPLPEVFLSTRTLTGVFSMRNWDLCHSLDPSDGRPGVYLTPDELAYGWTDACTDGFCGTELRMFFSEGVDAETNGKADQMAVTLYATITPESNPSDPFYEGKQLMWFDRIQLDFFRSNNGKEVGSCMWYTDVYNYGGDQARAVSFPDN